MVLIVPCETDGLPLDVSNFGSRAKFISPPIMSVPSINSSNSCKIHLRALAWPVFGKYIVPRVYKTEAILPLTNTYRPFSSVFITISSHGVFLEKIIEVPFVLESTEEL
ncbi:hypothetical protein GDO81_010177 [Engystomops pustulosus]|uniref:Uncharacterized protein n=1 Tax=Engystomops pustulosus TaxID=76066 RepID=A0AAV7BXN8_ENGPU|nr:hypothetical protein GDO81_010177 [Engystomops pustulosus]